MPYNAQKKSLARNLPKQLKIMQVNVKRSSAANDLALTHTLENQYDILLVQKPCIGANLDRQLSKKHNGFQAYAPEEVRTDRPRVMTYI